MTPEEIRRRLDAALPIREPLVDPNTPARQRVAMLEDYMRLTAWHRGELEEALHWIAEARKLLVRTWEGIEGWEVNVPRAARGKPSEADVHRAKRVIDPATWDAMDELKGLTESVGRQIRRLEIDDKTTSRLYTLITGS